MIFEFINENNEIIEESFPIGTAPSFITKDGVVYNRHYSAPMVIMDSDKPKTIGALADANTKKMEKEGTLPKEQDPKAWWRKNKTKKEIKDLNKLTPQQKVNYIQTGNKHG